MFLALRGCERVSGLLGSLSHQLLSMEAAWATACGQEEWGGSRSGCEGACGAWGSLDHHDPAPSSMGLAFSSAARS